MHPVECEMFRERVVAGLERARAQSKRLGRLRIGWFIENRIRKLRTIGFGILTSLSDGSVHPSWTAGSHSIQQQGRVHGHRLAAERTVVLAPFQALRSYSLIISKASGKLSIVAVRGMGGAPFLVAPIQPWEYPLSSPDTKSDTSPAPAAILLDTDVPVYAVPQPPHGGWQPRHSLIKGGPT